MFLAALVGFLTAHSIGAIELTVDGLLVPANPSENECPADWSVELLQTAALQPPAATAAKKLELMDAESQATRLKNALPIAWVHVPKCGSSLDNFMIHLPGVCPGVPEDVVISTETFGIRQSAVFRDMYDPLDETGKGACGDHFFSWGDHRGVGQDWEGHYKGHGFIMLRQPEQRTLSAYNYGWHAWPLPSPPADEREYAEVLQGCAVRILVREGQTPEETCGGLNGGPPSWPEVEEAIRRLRTGFAFVGLTDEWPLSICLGHRMFGGGCKLSDFVDGRVTDRTGDSPTGVEQKTTVPAKAVPYHTSVLRGFRDPYDGALYEAAQEVFQDEMEHFGVSLASCQPCFEEAGVSLGR